MPALTLANLALYAAQAALLIGALALALAALRPTPAFRLAACRAVLVVLLLLPFQGLLLEAPHGAIVRLVLVVVAKEVQQPVQRQDP